MEQCWCWITAVPLGRCRQEEKRGESVRENQRGEKEGSGEVRWRGTERGVNRKEGRGGERRRMGREEGKKERGDKKEEVKRKGEILQRSNTPFKVPHSMNYFLWLGPMSQWIYTFQQYMSLWLHQYMNLTMTSGSFWYTLFLPISPQYVCTGKNDHSIHTYFGDISDP